MLENSFDKHITEELNKLKLKPADHVWTQVHSHMRARRRRKMIWWSLPFVLLLTGGAYWWLADTSSDPQLHYTSNDKVSTEQEPSAQVAVSDKDTAQTPVTKAPERRQVLIPVTDTKETVNPVTVIGERTLTLPVPVNTENHLNASTIPAVPAEKTTPVERMPYTYQAERVDYSLQTHLPEPPYEPTVLQKEAVKQKYKVKYSGGIKAFGGWSGIAQQTGAGGLFNNSKVFNTSEYSLNTGDPYVDKQLMHSPSYEYGAGVFGQAQLHPHWRVELGFQYHAYTTETNVGYRSIEERMINYTPNSAALVGDYYMVPGTRLNASQELLAQMMPPIESNEFKNHLHYIEVPVAVSYDFTSPWSKTGVLLTVGVQWGRLVKSEIVNYDEATEVLFKNESLLNSNKWSLHTGIGIELMKQRRHPITITPAVGYQINSLYRYDEGDRRYLWNGGISVGVKLF